MLCSWCGHQMADGTAFCPECGTNIVAPESTGSSGSQQRRPVSIPGPGTGTGPVIKRSSRAVAANRDMASRGARLGAAIIDMIIVTPIMMMVVIGMGFAGLSDFSGVVSWDIYLVSAGVSFGVYLMLNLYLLAKNGQTIGKMVMGIKIVRKNRDRASLGRLVGLRLLPIWVFDYAPYTFGILGVIDALLIFRDERNCLHDDIADTRVVLAR